MDEWEAKIIVELREALGVKSTTLLSDLPCIARLIKRNAERYETIRRLNPQQFSNLWTRAMQMNVQFDELVDALNNES